MNNYFISSIFLVCYFFVPLSMASVTHSIKCRSRMFSSTDFKAERMALICIIISGQYLFLVKVRSGKKLKKTPYVFVKRHRVMRRRESKEKFNAGLQFFHTLGSRLLRLIQINLVLDLQVTNVGGYQWYIS